MNCKSAEVVNVKMVQHKTTVPAYRNCNFIAQYFKKKTQSWSKDQFLTIIILSSVSFFGAAVISIQAPFYPDVARRKGASATEYGFVFGVFELTVFIMSPIYGAKMSYLGPTRVFNFGILVTAICSVIFGFLDAFYRFLDALEGKAAFVWTGICIRIVEAMGTAAFETAAFTIVVLQFPDSVSSKFATLEMCVGLGMIVGPSLGGALYEIGGFGLPFFFMGGLLFASAIVTYSFLPDSCSRKRLSKRLAEKSDTSDVSSTSTKDPIHGGFQIFKLLRISSISLSAYSIVASTAGAGFISANLDYHFEQFHLNKLAVGAVFMMDGLLYALSTPVWGWICENANNLRVVTSSGAVLTILGFMIIGPVPYFPFEKTLVMSCVGLGLFSIGLSATMVASFLKFLKHAIKNGYADDVGTYGLVSGLWMSMNALGVFIGPTVGSALMDYVGFNWVTVSIIGGQFLLIILLGVSYASEAVKTRGTLEISTREESAADCEIMEEEHKGNRNMKDITNHPSLLSLVYSNELN